MLSPHGLLILSLVYHWNCQRMSGKSQRFDNQILGNWIRQKIIKENMVAAEMLVSEI